MWLNVRDILLPCYDSDFSCTVGWTFSRVLCVSVVYPWCWPKAEIDSLSCYYETVMPVAFCAGAQRGWDWMITRLWNEWVYGFSEGVIQRDSIWVGERSMQVCVPWRTSSSTGIAVSTTSHLRSQLKDSVIPNCRPLCLVTPYSV